MYKKILVPLAGPAAAEQALLHVYGLAEQTDAEIVLLHLARRPIGADLADDATLMLPLLANSEQEAERHLYDLLNHFPKTRVQVTTQVASGPAALAILDCAERAHADLIAFPHGRGNAVERWAGGRIMRTVIRRAQVPVLLIPPSC